MEGAVETVLPRQVGKLASTIEEKDIALVLLTDDLQNDEYENVALQAKRDEYQAELEKYQDTITDSVHVKFLMREILVRTTLSSLYGNIQHLPMTNIMTCNTAILKSLWI